jgi:hypothetical protein
MSVLMSVPWGVSAWQVVSLFHFGGPVECAVAQAIKPINFSDR